MDAWHWATVGVLSLAFLGEVVGAYGKQRRHFQERVIEARDAMVARKEVPGLLIYRIEGSWEMLWYDRHGFDRFPRLTVGLCIFVRGCTRLMLIAMIVARFAGEQDPLWNFG